MKDAPARSHDQSPRTPGASASLNVLYTFVLILAGLAAWSARVPNSDFFMMLGGGEDVAAGRLGKPDTWSYLAKDRIWMNQSWLTAWTLSRLWNAGGETAALAARCVLLVLWMAGLAAWLRARQVSWPAACLAVATVMLVCRYHTMLRGNLVTLAALPWLLWLLEKQRSGSPHWAWGIGGLLVVWAHCHGGFVYGWLLVLVWTLAHLIPAGLRKSPWTMRRWLLLPVVLAGSALATILTSPFGTKVFTQPYRIAGQAEWRTIREWWPLVRGWSALWAELGETFEEVGPYLLLLTALLLLAAAAGVLHLFRRRPATVNAPLPEPPAPETVDTPLRPTPAAPASEVVWARRIVDGGMIIATIAMAFVGRRFVALSVITLAYPLAVLLDALWTCGPTADRVNDPPRVARWPAAVGVVAAAVLAAALYPMIGLGFSAQHPFYERQSVFERQFMGNGFPLEAARFMRVHDVAGPVFHPYGLETYLYWAVPNVQVGCGGRAQQIYTEAELKRMRVILDTRYLQPLALSARNAYFARQKTAAIVLQAGAQWELILALVETADWVPVFFDGEWCVLVQHERYAPLWTLIQDMRRTAAVDFSEDRDESRARAQAAQGTVVYPDEPTRLRTLALYLASPRLDAEAPSAQEQAQLAAYIFKTRADVIERAQAVRPAPLLYSLLDHLARRRGEENYMREYLNRERNRLAALPREGPRSADVVRCRAAVAGLLARRLREAGDAAGSKRMQAEAGEHLASLQRQARWWQL